MFNLAGFSQSKVKENNFNISDKTIDLENSQMKHIEITWDFSGHMNKAHTNLEIEIQPLNGCWSGLDGTIRSEKITKTFKDMSQNPKGKILLTSLEYNAKCFKWRAKITNTTTGDEHFTNWQFSSFM